MNYFGRIVGFCDERSAPWGRGPSEIPFHGKLEYAWAIQRIDDEKFPEALLRNEITPLVLALAVPAGRAERLILNLADTGSILDVVIRIIQKIEGLRLNGHRVALSQVETSRQPEVDLLSPGTIKGVQTRNGAWAAAVDA